MKRKLILFVTILTLIVLSFLSFSSYAVEENNDSSEQNLLIQTLDEQLDDSSNEESNSVMTASSEYIGDQYLIADTVTVPEGIYDSNIYVIGKDVEFNKANIKGNVFVIANNLTFDATTISGSLYTIAGKLEGKNEFNAIDVYAIAQILTMDSTITINRSFKAMGCQVTLNGNYTYDVDLLVDDAPNVNSVVDKTKWKEMFSNDKNIVGKLTLGDELRIGGTFNYSAKEEAIVPTTASIGNINYSVIAQKEDVPVEKEEFLSLTTLLKLITRLVNTVFVTILLGWSCKKFRRINQYRTGAGLFFKSIIKGTIGGLLFIIAAVLLCVSGPFAGIGAVGVNGYVLAMFFALPITANMIAINILGIREDADEQIGYKVSMLGLALVVAIAIWLINLIPVAGSFVTVLLFFMGIGGFMDLIFASSKRLENRYQNKMSNKYKAAKINDNPQFTETEEPKVDDSEAFGNTSVMVDDSKNEEEAKEVEPANIDDAINSFANETADTPTEKEVENNDKSDDDSSKE